MSKIAATAPDAIVNRFMGRLLLGFLQQQERSSRIEAALSYRRVRFDIGVLQDFSLRFRVAVQILPNFQEL
jgi:hypothetical protein